MMKILKTTLVLVPAIAVAVPAAAATMVLDASGRLAGARAVTIAGKSYDVSFVDGTCASVFGTCANAAFTFTTGASAKVAAQALLDQVFRDTTINGRFYRFDQLPSLTVGCGHPSFCQAFIPVETQFNGAAVSVISAVNGPSDASDRVGGALSVTTLTSQTDNDQVVYARFSEAVMAVPEPATWAMMLVGFAGIGLAMRRRANVRATVVFR